MSPEEQGGQNAARSEYNAARHINFAGAQNLVELRQELDQLRQEVAHAARADVIDEGVSIDAAYDFQQAIMELEEDDPDVEFILTRLEEAKAPLAPLSAATPLVKATEEAQAAVERLLRTSRR